MSSAVPDWIEDQDRDRFWEIYRDARRNASLSTTTPFGELDARRKLVFPAKFMNMFQNPEYLRTNVTGDVWSVDAEGFHGKERVVSVKQSKLGFPPALKEKFENREFLRTTTSGELWSVEYLGKQIVVKIFHDRESAFVTWNTASKDPDLMRKLVWAQIELENSKDMRFDATDRGSRFILDVYGSNFADAGPNDPLYMLLEDCGENLPQFTRRTLQAGTGTPELAFDIYVQLLEALAYLGRGRIPWVHGKVTGSVMIKTLPDDQVEVRLVDLKNAMACDEDDDDDISTCWRLQSYDMMASLAVLIELVMGVNFFETIVGLGVHPDHMMNELYNALKDAVTFVQNMQDAREFEASITPFKTDTLYSKVLRKAVSSLSSKEGSSAKAMLSFIKKAQALDTVKAEKRDDAAKKKTP